MVGITRGTLQLHTICSTVQFNTIQTKLQLANQVLLQASAKIFFTKRFLVSLEWLKEARDVIKSSLESLWNMDMSHTQKRISE